MLESAVLKGASYWKPRLLHRKYLEFAQTNSTEEYSVRIEHAGTSHYFRLGTSHAGRAAIQAARIQRVVMGQGWEAANARFRRELTLAFRWTDNPVAWTYTTIHTPTPAVRTPPVVAVPNPTAQLNVAVVEADAGLRHTLASCIADQPEFCCIATFATLPEALRWLSRWQIRILLANHSLASTSEKGWVGELKTIAPSVTCLPYSVYEDSDQLFASVPGGAAGYFLKRLPSNRLLEPVAATVGGSHFSSHESAAGALQYFRRLLQPLPDSHGIQEISKLTHREQEVLSLLSKGYLDKSIADALKISIWTVHGHVKNIFQKLNVHTRIGAVVKFLQK